MQPPSLSDIERAHETLRRALLEARTPAGIWEGRLASSALATVLASAALHAWGEEEDAGRVRRGLDWAAADQNADGGWGDTPAGPSNVQTTLLALAAFRLCGRDAFRKRADAYVQAATGGRAYAEAVESVYGTDRTFAAPILAFLATADLVPWDRVPPLPFAAAALPRRLLRWLRLEVVSYALPALVAVGWNIEQHRPARRGIRRFLRRRLAPRALRRLRTLQPESGGFLEAVPLTAFVLINLCGAGERGHPAAPECVRFLRDTQRADGSWPIDTDLALWLTTQSVAALAGDWEKEDRETALAAIRHARQTIRHPFTDAAPGGWAWTFRSGGVPDADDTAGALLALATAREAADADAARAGLGWLLALQNRDGGWPTFCRGWTRLPFDRSASDITAHVLRALHAWRTMESEWPLRQAMHRGIEYLRAAQGKEGDWLPLWFGSPWRGEETGNPVLGTARVLQALEALSLGDKEMAGRGTHFLLRAQNPDGGWGGAAGVRSSVEETSLALDALCGRAEDPAVAKATARAAAWLLARIGEGLPFPAAPIGLYFARLWYDEALYPLVWATAALGRYRRRRRVAP